MTEDICPNALVEQTEEFAPILYTFANRQPAPELEIILSMFYTGAMGNRLGIMQAFNAETNEEEILLVGVAVDAEGKAECFPLAKILASEDVALYKAPDGKGGWYSPTDHVAVQAVKDEMKPVDESIVNLIQN